VNPLTSAQDAVDAVRDTILARLPDVLAVYEAAYDVSMPMPATVDLMSTVDAMSSVATPAFAVAETGMAEPYVIQGNGLYEATYGVVVRILCRGQDYDDTSRLSRLYAAAIERALIQSRTLGGVARAIVVTGEGLAPVDAQAARTLAGRDIDLDVTIRDALNPAMPPELPFTPTGPLIKTTEVDVTRKD
jgi:hypothetical protein